MSVGEIRTATQADIEQIGQIIISVWPESSINPERIIGVLNDPTHSTMAFVSEGVLAGFVDGFLTTSGDGIKRWELDLLAVHPDFQRRGIASSLVTANTEVGKSRGAEIARGLVAVGNTGSENAFAKCGYQTDGIVCDLMVVGRSSENTLPSNGNAQVVVVHTMNYSGLWIEGECAANDLQDAIYLLAVTDCDLAGAVIPKSHTASIQAAADLGYERVGRYQWWQRPLE